jgi:hypothetical protein
MRKELREYFRKIGSKGGKKAAAHMNPDERQKRAKKASDAALRARRSSNRHDPAG